MAEFVGIFIQAIEFETFVDMITTYIHYLHNTIMQLFNPAKFCILIVCNFSWDMNMSQE